MSYSFSTLTCFIGQSGCASLKATFHLYYDPVDDGWLIVVDEEQVTDEIIPKYIEELNQVNEKQLESCQSGSESNFAFVHTVATKR